MKFFVNFLSIFRILVSFAIIPLFIYKFYALSFVFFVLGSISDFLDGYLARKYSVCSKLGGVLDHTADKLLVINSFIAIIIAYDDYMYIVIPIILMIARELYISGLREFLGSQKLEMPVPKERFALGKIKTTMQMISLCVFFLFSYLAINNQAAVHYTTSFIVFFIFVATLYIAFILSMWSGIKYTKTFLNKIKNI